MLAAFYPFGLMFTDRTLGHVDDHSIFVYLRTTPFSFYDKTGRNLRVSHFTKLTKNVATVGTFLS